MRRSRTSAQDAFLPVFAASDRSARRAGQAVPASPVEVELRWLRELTARRRHRKRGLCCARFAATAPRAWAGPDERRGDRRLVGVLRLTLQEAARPGRPPFCGSRRPTPKPVTIGRKTYTGSRSPEIDLSTV